MFFSFLGKSLPALAALSLTFSIATASAKDPSRDEVAAWASDFLQRIQTQQYTRHGSVPIGDICDSYADGSGAVICYPPHQLEIALEAARKWQPEPDIAAIEATRPDAPEYMEQYIDRALAILEDRRWRAGRFLGYDLFESDYGGTAYNVPHAVYQSDRVGQTLSETAEFHLWNDLELDIAGAWATPVGEQSEEIMTRGAVDQLLKARLFMLCALMENLQPNPICEDLMGEDEMNPLELGRIMLLGAWDQQENLMRNGIAEWRIAAFDSQRSLDHDFAAAVAQALEDPNVAHNPNNPIWTNPFLIGNPYTAILYGE